MLLAVGVVKVLTGREDFDGLGPAANESVEQAGVETLFDVDEGGNGFLHSGLFSRVRQHPPRSHGGIRFLKTSSETDKICKIPSGEEYIWLPESPWTAQDDSLRFAAEPGHPNPFSVSLCLRGKSL